MDTNLFGIVKSKDRCCDSWQYWLQVNQTKHTISRVFFYYCISRELMPAVWSFAGIWWDGISVFLL
ncbi:MAG: hypothetical protein CMP10_18275 [Zetaproteobacteria bacterium]|nr:hypothetical protein [Pseudobdellovibrionaceae bacterium]